jgi:hypothetical protein
MKNLFAYAVLLLAGVAGAWFLLPKGFNGIQELRQLERVPTSPAAYVLPGEVTLSGRAIPLQHTTGSYYTQTPSLYYRYVRERKKTDSEGRSSWQTEVVRNEALDFLLQDDSGQVLVRAYAYNPVINWSLRERFSETQGAIRHREWRLEPGDPVFIFGQAAIDGDNAQIVFNSGGFYTPLISHFSQAESQASFGNRGLWWLWGGLCCVILAVLALSYLLTLHRVLAFVVLLGFTMMLVLVHLSLTMIRQDLQNALTSYQSQKKAAEDLAQIRFAEEGLAWSGWQTIDDLLPEDAERLQAYKRHLALRHQHLTRQMSALPERWLVSLWGLPAPEPVPLSVDEQLQIHTESQRAPVGRLKGLWPSVAVGAGFLAALLMTWLALRLIRNKRLIENLQLTPTAGVSCGQTEVQGEIVPTDGKPLLRTPYFQLDCVWYSHLTEERRRSGKTFKWVKLHSEVMGQPFWLRDTEGQLLVKPEQAEIITRHRHQKVDGKLRYTETLLLPGDKLYAVASAVLDAEQPDRLLLRKDQTDDLFLLSNYSERYVMLLKARSGMMTLCFAFAGLLLAGLMGFGLGGGFSPMDFLAAAAFIPLCGILLMLVLHYNDIIFLQRRALRNWANVEVALKKRKELVDGFAKTAKAFLDHEKNLQQKLSQLRAALTQTQGNRDRLAEYLRQEQQFHGALVSVMENYPDLKAQQLLQQLMNVLTRGETEIALLRQGYNDAVTAYNTRIASVPDVLFARLFHFRRMELIGE